MPRMLDVSEDVRAEIGDEEADRLLAGDNAPGNYDCTSCRTPGDSERDRTSTVLFVGEETAVLAFAHAACLPSQVVPVSEEQLQGAVRSITGAGTGAEAGNGAGAGTGTGAEAGTPGLRSTPAVPAQTGVDPTSEWAVLGVTSGLVLVGGEIHPSLVLEPQTAISRPGSDGSAGDEFLTLLLERGFRPVADVNTAPPPLPGWSVLVAMGKLHAVLQPGAGGQPVAWWQAHEPMQVTDEWRSAVNRSNRVLVYAVPVGSDTQQPREDQLREALDKAAANGRLVAVSMPLAGT
ncbi:hypothetical protein [Streptomyces sp. GC420]|uniref:hypothetical protein n=1 Tax=Streptomyces sp. GC420 TaxID=2697568 RepID=UPI001414D5F5|nr:hypothetical protein [Streptomyces sp. GC420]NBM17915.1 hypothetical protein [Streptomyces sp. GC420]